MKLTRKTILTAVLAAALIANFSFIASWAAEPNVTTSTGGSFDTLAEAIKSVTSDGTVVNVNADTAETAVASANNEMTINLNGHTVTTSSSGAGFISVNKDLTVNGGGGKIASSDSSGRAFNVQGANLTIKDTSVENFKSGEDGGAMKVLEGNIIASGCTFKNNTSTNYSPSGFMQMGGGAIYIRGTSNQGGVSKDNSFTGCTFTGNTADESGGALFLSWYVSAEVKNCTFTGNAATRGGAIATILSDTVLLTDNTISGNTAVNKRTEQSDQLGATDRAGTGGGIYILAYHGTTNDITLERNAITGNSAKDEKNNFYAARGGGLYIEQGVGENYSMDKQVHLLSGEISGNTARMGAGIGYTPHRMSPLYLKNVLISENEALRGAGVWLCGNGSLYNYSTMGGTIVDNKASGSSTSIPPKGDDISNEGENSDDKSATNDKVRKGSVDVNPRALGGAKIDWYSDEKDARYSDGKGKLIDDARLMIADPLPSDTLTDQSFGIHSEIPVGKADAKNLAVLKIVGNKASSRGGAIAANSPIIIGEDTEKQVKVEKKWDTTGASGSSAKIPESLTVKLLRVEGDKKTEIETVKLTAEGKWAHTFNHLPSNYDYDVEEVVPDGWTLNSSDKTMEGDTAKFTLTNEKKPDEPEEPEEKEDDGTITKTVNGEQKVRLKKMSDAFTYRIITNVPKDAKSCIIEDDMPDVLEFTRTHETEVTIAGTKLTQEQLNSQMTRKGNVLTFALTKEQIDRYAGEEMVVAFKAKYVANVDLSGYKDYVVPNYATKNVDGVITRTKGGGAARIEPPAYYTPPKDGDEQSEGSKVRKAITPNTGDEQNLQLLILLAWTSIAAICILRKIGERPAR